jgi:hypothetical protein
MINEANASSSACRLWRDHMVETSAPPSKTVGAHYPLTNRRRQIDTGLIKIFLVILVLILAQLKNRG